MTDGETDINPGGPISLENPEWYNYDKPGFNKTQQYNAIVFTTEKYLHVIESVKVLSLSVVSNSGSTNPWMSMYPPVSKINTWLILFYLFPPTLTFPTTTQFSSVAQLCPTLCDPMNLSTPGLPVHHQLPEFTQTHVHWIGDAIQPSHPLSSPSPPAPNPSQHQSLFQWVNSSHEVAKVLEFQL